MSESPIINGSFVFFTFFASIIVLFFISSRQGFISKDSFKMIAVIASVLAVATWILWLCCWMHQWHPLIYPIWKD